MTILCANGCHVYSAGSLRCTCGQAANGYPPTSAMLFPGYNPFGPRAPKPDPPAETSLQQLRAAQRAGASHLSADGLRCYCQRYGETLEAGWNDERRIFGAWSVVAELPADAVRM